MSDQYKPFEWIGTTRELRIIPQYNGEHGFTQRLDHNVASLTLELSILASDGVNIIDFTHRLEQFDKNNNGTLSSSMAVANQTIKRERMVNAMLDIKEWPLLKPYMEGSNPDFIAIVDMWIAIGKVLERELSLITFDWYDRKN